MAAGGLGYELFTFDRKDKTSSSKDYSGGPELGDKEARGGTRGYSHVEIARLA